MASTTHGPAVEDGELLSSPTTAQQVIPGLATQPHIPVPRSRPPIPASNIPTTIPAPTAQPAPEEFAGPIQRSFPPRPVRPPFLWGIAVKVLGQGAFGTVYLVHQTAGTDPMGAPVTDLMGARKVGAIPQSLKIPKASDSSSENPLKSLPIWKEYQLPQDGA